MEAHVKNGTTTHSPRATGEDITSSLIDEAHFSETGLPEPPDGGLQAWLVVAGAFFVWLNTWGAINAFGVFQTYYQLDLLESYSPSEISWIGSVQNFLVLFVGFLSGPLYDAGYTPYLLGSGMLLTVSGTMMLSLAHHNEYYQVFLSQAICVGLGWGLMFTPAASLPSRYFKKNLPLATGLASAGTGIGGVVYSTVLNQLLPAHNVGFPWAVRALGLLALATLLFSTMTLGVRLQSRACRSFIDVSVFHEPSYNAYLVGGVFTMAGLSTPYYYANLYAIDTGATSTQLGFYVITAMNAGSVFGRLIPPYLALRKGVFNTFISCYIATFTVCFCFIFAQSSGSVFAVASLYGFFSGAIVALSPVTLIQMTSDPTLVGTRMGMAFAIPSIGVLVGGPICGAILKVSNSYTYVWIFSGICIAIGAFFMIVCRIALPGTIHIENGQKNDPQSETLGLEH